MSDKKHLINLLAQPGLQLLLAVIGGMLLAWPVIHIAGEAGHWALYIYVFTVWAGLVLLLVWIGRAISRCAPPQDATPGPGAH